MDRITGFRRFAAARVSGRAGPRWPGWRSRPDTTGTDKLVVSSKSCNPVHKISFQPTGLVAGQRSVILARQLIASFSPFMPEIFRVFGFRFLFYSNDHLPVHVHVRNSDGEARFSINPVQLMDNRGMKPKDLKIAEGLIEENEDIIAQRWKEFFHQ